MEESYKYIYNLLNVRDVVVLAISGGPDSIVLLDLLEKISKLKKIKIIVAHVNHNLRKESQKEYEYIKQLCHIKQLSFEFIKINSYDSGSIEQQARNKRYEFFAKIVKKYKAKYLMTAHHGDDLIETILMRITRGSNLSGYCGFKLKTAKESYYIIRPLIFTNKAQILKYLKNNNLKYFVDQTNNLDIHTRNRYRKYILPALYSESEHVNLKYLDFSNELQQTSDYIHKIIVNKSNDIFVDDTIYINKLIKEDIFIINKMIEYILHKTYKNKIYKINKKHLNMIKNMLFSSKANMTINLPQNIDFIKEYHLIKIRKREDENSNYIYKFNIEQLLPDGSKICEVKTTNDFSNYYICLNSKEIKMPIIIRNCKNDDVIEVKNLNGHKKVNEIFINEKIPLRIRKIYPIVTDSNDNILWIPGIKKSKFDKKGKNYDIILKYQEKEGK